MAHFRPFKELSDRKKKTYQGDILLSGRSLPLQRLVLPLPGTPEYTKNSGVSPFFPIANQREGGPNRNPVLSGEVTVSFFFSLFMKGKQAKLV